MRLIPIITAILVAAVLYAVVFERERILEFASSTALNDEETESTAADETAQDASPTDPAGKGAVRVVAIKSEARVIDSAVVLRGETAAAREVDIRAETSGQVISTPLRKGAFVEAGQELCVLDAGTRDANLAEALGRLAEARARIPETEARIPEAEARVEESRAMLDEALINSNAATKLSEGGFASSTRVASTEAAVRSAQASVRSAEAGLKAAISGTEATQAGIQSAEANVAAARKEIERLTMYAPFNGLLESDSAELGSLLQAGSLCATVIQLDPIKIVGFVPETEVERVEVGALAGARLAGGTQVRGRVAFLSRSADPTTRTFRVEIDVPNSDLKIRDGQTAEILIEAEGAQAHLLPQSSLTLNDEGALGIRAVDQDNTVQFYGVDLMRDTREGVWVRGLPDMVNVITVGQEFVVDGVAVEPTFAEVSQ